MLGHHGLLERKLRKHGRRAPSVVLVAKRTHFTEAYGNAGEQRRLWKLRVRVEPEGEAPFEADVEDMLWQTWEPAPGAHFPVLFDPSDHGKVVVDHSEEGEQRLQEQLQGEAAHERADRLRAAGQGDLADRYEALHDPKLGLFRTDDLSANPEERTRQLAERRAKIKEMMGGTTFAAPTRPAGPAADVSATADALTKLADLRDRGVLSDEEFQAQKRKLLGE